MGFVGRSCHFTFVIGTNTVLDAAACGQKRRNRHQIGRAPDLMRLRGDKFKTSSISLLVRNLLRARPRGLIPERREASFEAELRGELEVR
jgi:hypothetical protein